MSNKIVPILHYDFEHFTEDGKVEDMSGNGYHGTISGATRCEDMWGNPNSAMSFDGVDDSIIFGQELNFGTNDFSIFIMSKYDSISSDYETTLAKGSYVGVGYLLFYNYSDSLMMLRNDDSGIDVESINDVECGTMYHAWCINRVGDVMSLYRDGEMVKSHQLNTSYDFTNNEHWSLGSRMSGEEAFGNIKVDKLKMYRDIITPTQVKHISTQMMRKIGRQ
jgi:hypothetical protein